ncbi:alpha-(1,3)-fucosyltransferase 7-like [Lethenteron reissneri]|uniref:alpha-(1,3)-fucosyltransferase 7-like n=1 Tax=Lethenteron reissneri TaxID=7753 RepID=UPI002AB7DCC8|nr:alpha-(1,3)-fucosyltransferase 7-like [Lethenteron reissneri]
MWNRDAGRRTMAKLLRMASQDPSCAAHNGRRHAGRPRATSQGPRDHQHVVSSSSSYYNNNSNNNNSSSRNLTVLAWRWPFTKGASPLRGDECLGVSPRCLLSQDARLLPSADAVVFLHRHVRRDLANLPLGKRPPGQIWVWGCMEPPPYAHLPRGLHTVFNWTLTYRPDSDVPTPYGWLEPREEGEEGGEPPCGSALKSARAANLSAYACSGKSELVAWAVSHGGAASGRDAYHRELALHLRVAVYGRGAGRTALPQLPAAAAGGTAPVLSRYLFYLAFENARSRHYVTEKLWANALGSAAAVPVALGPPRADYERATLPPAAFLHVDDFASPRELALRLRALAADGAAYGRMHAWRRRYRARSARGWDERLCAVFRFSISAADVPLLHALFPPLATRAVTFNDPLGALLMVALTVFRSKPKHA